LDWALAQPWAVELVRDVDWWWRRVRHLAGERDAYQPRCRRCSFPVEPSDGGMWRCLGCGNETSLDAALSRLAEPLVTVPQASQLLDVPERTVRRWAKYLLPVDLSGPRYLLKDLRHAADNQPMRGRPPAS
ncbi:hypothetical protein, partial [Corynebacterium variabile]|uniref:hypothetical protein n=1 Tax=Corynebacterium variabile TaxID=1727 RepID=UPI00264760E0